MGPVHMKYRSVMTQDHSISLSPEWLSIPGNQAEGRGMGPGWVRAAWLFTVALTSCMTMTYRMGSSPFLGPVFCQALDRALSVSSHFDLLSPTKMTLPPGRVPQCPKGIHYVRNFRGTCRPPSSYWALL